MLQGVDFTNFSTGPEPGWTDKRGRPPRGQDRGRGRPRDTLLATRFLRYDLQLQLLRPAQHGKRAAHSHVGVGEQAMQIIHAGNRRSEEHTSELQSPYDLVCRLLLEKKNKTSSAVPTRGLRMFRATPPHISQCA